MTVINRFRFGLKGVKNKEARNLMRSAIPISEFGPDYIRRGDKYVAILKITDPVNRELLSEEDTERVIESIQSVLNMLQIENYVQFLISSQKIDMDKYLKYLDTKLESLLINAQYGKDRLRPDERFKIERIEKAKEFIHQYRNKARNVPAFFIAVQQENLVDLDNMVSDLIRFLSKEGRIGIERMKKREIQKLLYQKLAPSTSEDQPFEIEEQEGGTPFDITKWTPNEWRRVGFRYMMDDTYYSFFTISYIPEEVSPGWLDSLIHSSRFNPLY